MNHCTMKFLCITLLLWIGFPFSAIAAEAEASSGEQAKVEKVEVGTRTSQWLDIQREGRVAGNLLPIPGEEAGLSYQRHMNSFNKPIPDKLLETLPVSTLQK